MTCDLTKLSQDEANRIVDAVRDAWIAADIEHQLLEHQLPLRVQRISQLAIQHDRDLRARTKVEAGTSSALPPPGVAILITGRDVLNALIALDGYSFNAGDLARFISLNRRTVYQRLAALRLAGFVSEDSFSVRWDVVQEDGQ